MLKIQKTMFSELDSKDIFQQAQTSAFEYLDQVENMPAFPANKDLQNLSIFEEKMPLQSGNASELLHTLHQYGSPATVAHTAGRYFGFVLGGAVPISLATKWLSDTWDQCGGLYLTSPINAQLESVCESWLKELLNLPSETVAGFVSGTSMANLCGLAAARFRLLQNLSWDVNKKGLNGAPPIRIIAHLQVHSSIKKTLALLGFGTESIEWVNVDTQGRMLVDDLPKLDHSCLVLLQAGNVNSGSFDHFSEICDQANEVGAWVHIDGAFGLWAQASKSLSKLTNGIEKASSWAVDGHKTLNTPYDSGIILCKDQDAIASALQASGEYIIYSDKRDPLLFTPELSKRSRAIELWATMKYLGKEGIDEMVTGFHELAVQLSQELQKLGYRILNEVVFNQILVANDNEAKTLETLERIQESGVCWCGGSKWDDEMVIRISICSWATTEKDIALTVSEFKKYK